MQASKKITIAIVSIYSLVFLALAVALFTQAKTDVEREARSAMLMAQALTEQGIPAQELQSILDLNRHLSTQILADPEVKPRIEPLSLLYQPPELNGRFLLIQPNPESEVAEIRATVLPVFGIFIFSLLLTLKSLRVAVQARLKPLQSLCNALSSIPKGEYHVEVARSDINEINELIEHYSAMAEGLDKKEHQVTRLRTRLADLMENERRSLARELHDNLGQIITAITVQSYMLGQQSHNQIFVKKYANEIQKQCDEVQNCLRIITNQLYPVALARVGLIAGLKEMCESWQKMHNITVAFSVSGLPLEADLDRDTHIYRIAQEALNNVAKHAQTHEAAMAVEVRTRSLKMRIEDNGVGMEPGFTAESDTLGMASMQDRASLIAAQIQFMPSPAGLVIELRVPLVCTAAAESQEGNDDQYSVGG
ncbi:sensor histidine kinase [Halioxenophilus aromaticivorans]|uniref:histidine kinase n=1 Tax=Halioxenophilus aromaticivorans TaxID=1306992 RepID=A0AAV3U4B2_9ALTE